MTRGRKDPLRHLTADERTELERVSRAGSERADRVAHAKALLAVADGARFIDAARVAGRRSRHAVAHLVVRFNAVGLAALDRQHGGGPAIPHPAGRSWLNMAESIQRIVVRGALAGQHSESTQDMKEWLTATVRGWNTAPTPFAWGGKRAARRERARARRHALGGSGGYTRRPICRWRRHAHASPIHGYHRAN